MNPPHTPIQAAPAISAEIVRPGDAAYDELRRVHSPLLDRRPAAIARVRSTEDVVAALRFARSEGLAIGVRGGGHSLLGVVDGGLLIDLRGLDAITVDRRAPLVHVGGGALGGAVDAALAEHALAVTTPRMPSVGMTGFTLGSGSGWLERAAGLAADRVRAATVVTADGRVVRASADEHAELLWALRGGGGNFGVVTELELEPIRLGPAVRAGVRVYPFARLREVAGAYDEVMAAAPPELCGGLVIRCLPGAEEPVILLVALWAGEPAGAADGLAPLDRLGEPVAGELAEMPYARFQELLLPPPEVRSLPMRSYVRFAFTGALGAGTLDVLASLGEELGATPCMIMLQPLGGAVAAGAAAGTALGARDARWAVQLVTSWTDPADDAPNIAWTRAACAELLEHGTTPPWPNLITDESRRTLAVPYAKDTLARLRAAKAAWDPDNLFRANHNITPA
jgi:FAD/FMN-containing dehydrogenase